MAEKNNSSAHEFSITRTVNAQRATVFKAWTEAEHLKRWWGPKGFDLSISKLDLRPGGMFHYRMKAPNMEMWGKFIYREIVAPEKLVYVLSFSDANAGMARHPMAPTWPMEMLTTVTFTENAGKTTVTLRSVPHNASAEECAAFVGGFASMTGGFGSTFDQLDRYIADVEDPAREYVVERLLNAPRALVYKVFTDPQHLTHWWGPNGFRTTTHEMNVKAGGLWRYIMHGPDGKDWNNRIEYTEVVPQERLVYIHGTDDEHCHFNVVTTFADQGGKTALRIRMIFATVEACEGTKKHIKAAGGNQTWDRLAAYLEKQPR